MELATQMKQEALTNDTYLKALFDSPHGREATMLREALVMDEVGKVGFVELIKKDLHALIQGTMTKDRTAKEAGVWNLLSMFYTMLEENRMDELEQAFRNQFPEYYMD
jgi:hypothetical protein